MDTSPYQEVRLPESVETSIRRICTEKDVPPLPIYARKMLAEIGEPAALPLLEKVLSSGSVRSFGGFISYLIKKEYPNEAASVISSLPRSPSYSSPHKQNGENLRSPMSNGSRNSTSSRLDKTIFQNVSCQLSFEDEHRKMTEARAISQQLMTLSKLEYKKLFLVLSYIGKQTLEAAVTVDDAKNIFDMKNLPMKDFEPKIWNKYGQHFCDKADRRQYLDWDSGKTHLYYCYISPDRSYYFKGPYLNSSRTHLQKSLGDDNVLTVKFLEDGAYDIKNVVDNGIFVGLRQYKFFVFKDEHKKGKKNNVDEKKASYSASCYFIHFDSASPCAYDKHCILDEKSIGEARRLFMHVHTLPSLEKYMARFSLILSKTTTLGVDLAAVIIERIKDIPFKDENGIIKRDEDGKPILHTDGTGFISEDLAIKCPKHFTRGKYVTDNNFENFNEFVELEDMTRQRGVETRTNDPPLLMQIRLFHDGCAVKGTLLVNKTLEPGTIQIRPSMIKVDKDETFSREKNFSALEIVNISCRPSRSSLSRNLIALLNHGGVPQEFFLNLVTNVLEEARNVYSDKRAALKVVSNNDSLEYGFLAQRMISCGVPLDEPFLQYCLSDIESREKTKLREGKIPISESYYLMGTADPTGVLNYDEVCVILDNGQISGKVLVYRNPGLHFGDVHVMEAVYVKKLEEFVGNAKYGIFFSTKGCRSAAYEIATGDFDGDLYWVSRNPELLKYYKASEPWTRTYKPPEGSKRKRSTQELSDSDLEIELFKLFMEARKPSFSMAAASESWLSFMDRLLTIGEIENCFSEKQSLKERMKALVDIYYDALDAPKTGKKVEVPNSLRANMYPHHMEKAPELSFRSSSVLGQIYDKVLAFKNETVLKKEIWKLPCLDAPTPEMYEIWRKHYEDYRRDMVNALDNGDESKNDAANDVIKKYKQLLYGAPEWEESSKESQIIFEEALAIYHVTYDYAMHNGVKKCGFAWKVAGSALCDLCAWKLAGPKEKPIVILPSVLRDMLR